jgi:agmatinase
MSDTFLNANVRSDASEVVILGAGLATVYPERQAHATGGASAIRAASMRLAGFIGNYDFDSGAPFAPWRDQIADGGDVHTDQADPEGNRRRITAAVNDVLDGGAIPVLLGGDDSIAAPFVAGWRDHGPITVVQLDAHLDFRDEVHGERHGYSSPMRRASEMGWVRRIIHIGQRGVGSARPADVQDSLAAGNTIIPARGLDAAGVEDAAAHIEPSESFVIVLDVDAIDPAQVPAVRAPVAAGPSVPFVGDLFTELGKRGSLRGLVITEFEPDLDSDGTSALILVRLISRLLDASLGEPS